MTVNLSRRVCKKIQYTLPIGPKRLSSSQVLIKRPSLCVSTPNEGITGADVFAVCWSRTFSVL